MPGGRLDGAGGRVLGSLSRLHGRGGVGGGGGGSRNLGIHPRGNGGFW